MITDDMKGITVGDVLEYKNQQDKRRKVNLILEQLLSSAYDTGYYAGKLECKEYQVNDYLLARYTQLHKESIEKRSQIYKNALDILSTL